MIFLGTSGFSYNDWAGIFYPQGLPRRDWLSYYAREFKACEVNSTYYAIPGASTTESMANKTGDGFLFCIKANQEMTHKWEDNADVFKAFAEALEPFVASGKLGCVLAQFPYSFRYQPCNLDYLGRVRERMGQLPVVVEFRNAGWLGEDVFSWLRRNNLGFCCVDEPRLANLMPPVAEATSEVGYVRFHGRNSARWWQHEQAYERYDYSYAPEELAEWVPKIKKLDGLAEKTFVFANNHWKAQAVNTIRQLQLMLE